MTWSRFVSSLVKLNIATALALWIGFWGYGILVGEMPPVSVIPGLALATLLICVGATVFFGVGTHSLLYVRSLRNGDGPKLTGTAKLALWTSLGLLAFIALTLSTDAGQVLDAIAATIGVFGFLAAFTVFLASASKGYLRSHFES